MLSRRYQWTALALTAALCTVMGCRGSRPLGHFVQISKTPDEASVPDVDAPRQRLAVNQAALRDQSGSRKTSSRDANPHVTSDSAGPASTAKTTSRRRPSSDTINVNLADRGKPRANAKDSLASRKSQAPSAEQTATAAADPIDRMSQEEMAKAFEDQPEDVKRKAMQLFLASMNP